MIERRYVLRPALPYIVTSFTLMLIGFWQGILVLELFFNCRVSARYSSLPSRTNEQAVSVGLIVLFALLLAVSVFVLDILYAIIDPRVKVGGRRSSVKPAATGKRDFRLSLRSLWPSRRPEFRFRAPNSPRSPQYRPG